MAERAMFWKGTWLWEHLQFWMVDGQRGDDPAFTGVRRRREGHNARSPNFGADVMLHCHVDQVAAYQDLELGSTLELLFQQLRVELESTSDVPGDLSFCEDPDRTANVTNGPWPEGIQDVSHDTPAGGWTPTVGRYVLCRDPASGEGFATQILVAGAGTIRIEIPTGVLVTTSWDLIDCQLVFPGAVYVTMNPGNAHDAGDREDWRPDVEYAFRTDGSILTADAHQVPRGNT